MNLHGRLVALFVILALAGCAQGPSSQGPAPYAPYSRDSGADMRSGGDGGGVVEAAVACSGQSVRKSTGTPPRAEQGAGAGDPPDTATREAAANRIIHVHRGTRVQKERADGLLLHLFQHQIHHRGQAHAMLSGTSAPPPQLDEVFSVAEAPLPAVEFNEL